MDSYEEGFEEQEEREEERTEEKVINEEYKTWKKNAPFLYDMILSTALEWPTLTTQWLPDKQEVPDKPYSTHRLLIGTHTSSDAQNYLQVAHVQLPNPTAPNPDDYDEERGEIGGYGGSSKKAPMEIKFNIVQKIDHKGEVNKARYQPQNPNVIATMCTDGRVMIWDRSKHPSLPTGTVNPQMELLGHTKEGFGLSWSPHFTGHLATGSEDKTVRLWDLTTYTKGNKALKPSRTYTHHSAIVNDVQHHPLHSSLIGTVSDDITLQILDIREPDATRAAASSDGQHRDAINSIAFNPAAETVLATGSADKTIGLWDLRNLKTRLHALEFHSDSVTSVSWHPFEEAVLASASYDRKIMFWDLSRAGEEQSPEDAQDGPPELLFMHGGHTNRISDFNWNLSDPWVLCSAAEDNLLQVWKVSDAIVGKDLEDVPTEELEPLNSSILSSFSPRIPAAFESSDTVLQSTGDSNSQTAHRDEQDGPNPAVRNSGNANPTLNDPPRDPRDEGSPLTPPSIVSRPESPYTLYPPIDFDGLSWPCPGTRDRLESTPEQTEERVQKLAGAVRTILECVGEDPEREGLRGTPERYAKAMMYFTKGYEENVRDLVNGAVFHEDHDELVIVKDIEVFSLCEHHMVPFNGKMHIGYIPDRRVLGLSKLARLAEMFSRRLQVQERLTKQVALAISEVLKPRGVGVVMESSHLCMVMRGVQKTGSSTTTSCMLGCMRSSAKTREEFLTLLHK